MTMSQATKQQMSIREWRVLGTLRSSPASVCVDHIASRLWPEQWEKHDGAHRGRIRDRILKALDVLEALGFVNVTSTSVAGATVAWATDEGRSYAMATAEYWRSVRP
jgi:hypothetical protein